MMFRKPGKRGILTILLYTASQSRTVRQIINNCTKNEQIKHYNFGMKIKSEIITDKEIIWNKFNNFFISLPKALIPKQKEKQ